MKLNKKKGFTIVELVIVIAVFAFLAAVLIPNISKLVKKANQSADESLVRNLNTALSIDAEKHTTMSAALKAALDNGGYDVAKIVAKNDGAKILWDSLNDCFVYLNADGKITYLPNTKTVADVKEWNFFEILEEMPTDMSKQKYSIYLSGEGKTVENKEVSVGFDSGKNTVKSLTYKNDSATAQAQDVIIRTNGGTLTVNAPKDVVRHFGASDYTDIVSVDKNSYHENGVSAYVRIENGHFYAEANAKVLNVNVANSNVKITVDTNAKVVAYSKSAAEVTVKVNGADKDVTEIKSQEDFVNEAKNSEVSAEGGVAEVNGIAYKSLISAIRMARSGETVKLLSDYVFTDEYAIEKDLTIDFNGCTLTAKVSSGSSALTVSGNVTVTLKDSSNQKCGKLEANQYGISAENDGTVVIEDISVVSLYACLSGNNRRGGMNFVVKSGTLTSNLSETVYMPAFGTLTISGGTLNGGISMRMGTLTMTGGTVNGMKAGQPTDSISSYWNYSGSAWIGDAIYVMAGTYTADNNDCVINLLGGTINGNANKAVCVYDIGTNYNQKVTITVSADVIVNGTVEVERDITNDTKYERKYPVDVTITTPAETIK